jgi:AcrR family transcriptional regulator
VVGEPATPESLDQRLVAAALTVLADTPAEDLSLRHVAQQLGVSHQAPYVHFGSRRRFLAAVAGAGLREAADEAAAAVDAAGEEPVARLKALARAYLSFIRARPHVHDLAYGPSVAKSDHPMLQEAAIRYWSLLHDCVSGCQPPGVGETEVLRRAAATWGAVYGIARLGAFQQIPDSVPADVDALVEVTLEALFAGWSAGRSPGGGTSTRR